MGLVAAFQVDLQAIREKSSSAVWARHKCFFVIILKCRFVIVIHVITNHLPCKHVVEVSRRLRQRATLVLRLQSLLLLPLPLACLKVDLETLGTILTTAYVADESLRFHGRSFVGASVVWSCDPVFFVTALEVRV